MSRGKRWKRKEKERSNGRSIIDYISQYNHDCLSLSNVNIITSLEVKLSANDIITTSFMNTYDINITILFSLYFNDVYM